MKRRSCPFGLVGCAGVLAFSGSVLWSCSDGPTGPSIEFDPGQTPVVVTEPVANLQPVSGEWAQGVSGALPSTLEADSDRLTYVSYAPGSVPSGDSVEVHNLSRDLRVGAPMLDGGVDPIPVPSSIGDSLLISIFSGGSVLQKDYAVVPKKNPPKIVRTKPGRRQTRVPLNDTIMVVFTEPISEESVDPDKLFLLNGTMPVPMTLTLSGDGLRVEFSPTEPLQRGTLYTILVTQGVADLAGDSIQEEFTSEFETDFGPGMGSVLVTTNTENNLDPDGFVVTSDDGATLAVPPSGSVTVPDISPGEHQVRLSGIGPNCLGSGENPRTVSVVEGSTSTVSFSVTCTDPPEGRILFQHSGSEGTWISVMNADGSGKIELLEVQGGEELGRSVWSPDGETIAFSDYNSQGGLEIYLMNKDASDVGPVRAGGDAHRWERNPAWHPGGLRILFEGKDGLREVAVNGLGLSRAWPSSSVPLENGEPMCQAPDWSPDGSRTVFTVSHDLVTRPGEGPGSHVVTLLRPPPRCGEQGVSSCRARFPIWSPTEDRILFSRTFVREDDPSGLWVTDPDGSNASLLADEAFWFDWSPDGNQIVYVSTDIYVMNADGTGLRLIRDLSENFDEAREKEYSRVSWGR